MARRRRKVLVHRSVSRCLSWALALGALSIAATPAHAQGGVRPPATRVDSADALSTALDAEDKGELKKDTAQITDLQEAFRMMDPDGKGHIEATQLQFICKKLGEDLTIQEVKEMVGEALIGFDGRIFYDGLLKILITQ